MNQSNVGLLDLPNEILLIILKKLNNMHVLYSLLAVDNQRLDILAQENTFTNTLNFGSFCSLVTPYTDWFIQHSDQYEGEGESVTKLQLHLNYYVYLNQL